MGSVGQLGAAHPGAMPPAGAYRGKASRPWRRDVSQRGLLGGFDRTVMQPRSRHAASPGGHEAPGGGGKGGREAAGPGAEHRPGVQDRRWGDDPEPGDP